MRTRLQVTGGAICILLFAASCGSQLSSRQLVNGTIRKMGGLEKLENLQTIVRRGSGTRTNLGQAPSVGGAEPVARILNYVEAVDLKSGSAAVDYDIQLDTFKQHRREVFTKFGESSARKPVGYYEVDGRQAAVSEAALVSYAVFDTPELAIHREITRILLAAAETAVTAQTVRQKEFNGIMCNFGEAKTANGESMTMYFDPDTELLAGIEITETDAVAGDIPVEYVYGDYRQVGGVLLPHHLKVRRNRVDSAELRFDSIATSLGNTGDWFNLPEAVHADAAKSVAGPFMPITITRLAAGVFQAQGFTHNSLVVEFPDYVAVIEAPQSETWARVLWREVRRLIPRKDIRYVIPTHHHTDHIAGIRGLVARGATVLVEKRHEPLIRTIIDAPHRRVRDELQDVKDEPVKKNIGGIEVFDGKHEISNKGRTIELHAIADSPHAAPSVIVYLPRERIVFQSDLFPTTQPVAAHFYQSIMKLNLRVDRIAGGHGLPAPIADLARIATTGS